MKLSNIIKWQPKSNSNPDFPSSLGSFNRHHFQEPENVADDHREQIINNLSDEDILLPDSPQIPGQNTPKPSTSSASERKRQIDNELQNIEAPKAKKPKSASLLDTIKQNHMDYRKFIAKKCPRS
jgi:hypothetical protein